MTMDYEESVAEETGQDIEDVSASIDILNAIGGVSEEKPKSFHDEYIQSRVLDWLARQVDKVKDGAEEKGGDREAYYISRVVIGQELAKLITPIAAAEEDFDGAVIRKLADIPVGFAESGRPIECQVLMSRRPNVIVLHYRYQGEESGKASVEAEAPDFGDDDTELEFFLENQ